MSSREQIIAAAAAAIDKLFLTQSVRASDQLREVLGNAAYLTTVRVDNQRHQFSSKMLVLSIVDSARNSKLQVSARLSPTPSMQKLSAFVGRDWSRYFSLRNIMNITEDVAGFPIEEPFELTKNVQDVLLRAAKRAHANSESDPPIVDIDDVIGALPELPEDASGAVLLREIGLDRTALQGLVSSVSALPRQPSDRDEAAALDRVVASAIRVSGDFKQARLQSTAVWQETLNLTKSPDRAFQALALATMEVFAASVAHKFGLDLKGTRSEDPDAPRALLMPGPSEVASPAIVLLDPKSDRTRPERPLNRDAYFDRAALRTRASMFGDEVAGWESGFGSLLAEGGGAKLLEAFDALSPEIVLLQRPQMQLLCAPSPGIDVSTSKQRSTAGVFCRDKSGVLGVTACYHGSGAIGTKVSVGLRAAEVSATHEVQDIAFIALHEGYNLRDLRGKKGCLTERGPRIPDIGTFDGIASGPTLTRIFSVSPGLLRKRPSVQLRIQTEANTERGDSGAALVDADGYVLGFAFERTAVDEEPSFTDWIWAGNAMAALDLAPIIGG